MTKILKIISIIIVSLFTITTSFAYDLTQKDEKIIDRIDTKAFKLVDSGKITEERLVKILKIYNSKKVKSERLKTILEIVIDDIEYEYFLGEYADEIELDEDFISDDFSWNEEISEEIDFNAIYSIDWNNLILERWEEKKEYKTIFEIFTTLVPSIYREQIIRYKVYEKPKGDTFAFVNQDADDQSKWNLVVNKSFFYKNGKLDLKESIHTLIHEVFHTISLSSTQMNHWDYDICENYELAEWCLNKNSYLNKFIKNYWVENFDDSQKEWNDFYLNNESDFVTEYASTNPWEDIAESFTYFILKEKPKNTDTISNQKILFFYDFKELVKLRNEIRKGIKLL